jgi:hypothetical protein
MDFGKLDVSAKSEEGSWMVIQDYEGDETDARIKVVGQDSKIFKKRMHRFADINRKKKNGLKAAEIEREFLETYASCCVEFENCFVGKKEIKADNLEDVIEFLETFRFILDQVSTFSGDRSNFLSN